MRQLLTESQKGKHEEFKTFVALSVEPFAEQWDVHLPEVFEKTLMAKYLTSRDAVRAASDAVQIRGASGCHGSSPVSRYYRDAKIMEIIEGTTQIHEHILGKIFVDQAGRLSK